MGHGHHEPSYKIPDYRIYKVEDVPVLMETKRALESQGLKDPWLRNEVWRFNEKVYGTFKQRLHLSLFRGFKWGFGAFVLTMVGTAMYERAYPPKHGHGHGHDHH